MLKTVAVTSFVVAIVFLGSISAQTKPIDVFTIGTKNGSHTEFAQNREAGHAVLYKVGESSAEKDWPAYQPGSFDSIVAAAPCNRTGPRSTLVLCRNRFKSGSLSLLRLKEPSFCISMPLCGIDVRRRLSTEL